MGLQDGRCDFCKELAVILFPIAMIEPKPWGKEAHTVKYLCFECTETVLEEWREDEEEPICFGVDYGNLDDCLGCKWSLKCKEASKEKEKTLFRDELFYCSDENVLYRYDENVLYRYNGTRSWEKVEEGYPSMIFIPLFSYDIEKESKK